MKYSIPAFLLLFALFSCIRKECKIPGGYEFDIPATLTPALDTFRVGDTISVSSVFGEMVHEIKTDKAYLLENFLFHPATSLLKIDTFPAKNSSLLDFEILIDTTSNYRVNGFSDGTVHLRGQYSYEEGRYFLEYKLIPQRSGLFVLSQACALQSQGENQDFPEKCNNVGSSARVTLNGGADNNVEFLRNSPDPHYSEWILARPEDRFHRGGGYCFYVVE